MVGWRWIACLFPSFDVSMSYFGIDSSVEVCKPKLCCCETRHVACEIVEGSDEQGLLVKMPFMSTQGYRCFDESLALYHH